MRVKNETAWSTADVKRLALRVADEELEPERRRRFVVYVVYRRRLRLGEAHYHGNWMRLFLPRPGTTVTGSGARRHLHIGPTELSGVQWAKTIAHEFAHCRGLKHREMGRRYEDKQFWAWAEAYPIRLKPVKPAPTPVDARAAKLARAEAMVLRWQRRQRAAERKVKAWQQRVKRLLRLQIAAASPPREEPEHGEAEARGEPGES